MARVPKVDPNPKGPKKRVSHPNAAKHNDALHIETQAKRDKAIDMRAGGFGYAQIAKQLGVSVKTAWSYVQDAAASIPAESLEKLREIEARKMDFRERRLNAQLAGHTKERKNPDGTTTTVNLPLEPKDLCKTIDSLTRIQTARARIFGLNAPEQHQHYLGDASALDNLTPEEMRRVASYDFSPLHRRTANGDGRSSAPPPDANGAGSSGKGGAH